MSLEKSFNNKIDKIDLKYLEEKLGNKVKCFLIEFGKNDEELMKNFHMKMRLGFIRTYCLTKNFV